MGCAIIRDFEETNEGVWWNRWSEFLDIERGGDKGYGITFFLL